MVPQSREGQFAGLPVFVYFVDIPLVAAQPQPNAVIG